MHSFEKISFERQILALLSRINCNQLLKNLKFKIKLHLKIIFDLNLFPRWWHPPANQRPGSVTAEL